VPVELSRLDDTFTVKDSDLVQGGDPGATLTIRHIPVDTIRELVKKHTHRTFVRHQPVEQLDDMGYADDQIDYAIVEWTGFTVKGAPVPCTREHKLKLDGVRRAAVIDRAILNRVTPAEVRAESFRGA
jgi:hypothetical protein